MKIACAQSKKDNTFRSDTNLKEIFKITSVLLVGNDLLSIASSENVSILFHDEQKKS